MITAREIQDDVAAGHCVETLSIRGKSNVRKIVAARNEFMGRLRNELGWSYPQIGELVGKHHTSVMRGVRQYMGTQPLVREGRHSTRVEKLQQTIRTQQRIIESMASHIACLARALADKQFDS